MRRAMVYIDSAEVDHAGKRRSGIRRRGSDLAGSCLRRCFKRLNLAPDGTRIEVTPGDQSAGGVKETTRELGVRNYVHEQRPRDRVEYESAEDRAAADRIGLWQDKNPIP